MIYLALILLGASAVVFYGFKKLNDRRKDLRSMVIVSGSLVGINVAVFAEMAWPGLTPYTTTLALVAAAVLLGGLLYLRRHELPQTERLETELDRFRTMVTSMYQGVVVYDPSGITIECNDEATRLLGVSRDELVGRTFEELELTLVKEDGSPLAGRRYPAVIAMRAQRAVSDTTLGIRQGKNTVWLSVRAQPLRHEKSDDIFAFVSYLSDVTQEKGRETRLHRLATEDPLTGLSNRRALEEHLREGRALGGRGNAVLIMDLDNFKVINDMLGHASGDDALIRIARLFESTVRPRDVVARLGGDEFVVLLKNVSFDEAHSIAERIRSAVAHFEYRVGGHRFHLGISIGLTMVEEDIEPRGLLMLADTALQEAKQTGKNRIVVHRQSESEGAKLSDFNRWAARIKDALKNNRFELHFQPIVSLSDEAVRSFEALIRMRARGGKLYTPEPFLSTAEYFNLMPEIDRWVVGHVLEVLERNPEWKVFVNLSGNSLNNDSLLDFIHESVQKMELAPGRLVFEVTETIAVANMRNLATWIHDVRRLGCQFALDDFGSGFSSFTYLHALPIDFVKIDGSYVSKMDSDPTSCSIVQSITGVCHAMGKMVIAEWVENGDIANLLKGYGVEYGQGYHWGRPKSGVLPAINGPVTAVPSSKREESSVV